MSVIAVVQLGLAMMPLCDFTSAALISGNHQRHLVVHAERARVVHDHATCLRRNRREFLRNAPASAEKCDVDAVERILGELLDREFSCRGICSFLPTERAEASNVNLPTGKLRFSSVFSISMPTAPVAPTTATCGS